MFFSSFLNEALGLWVGITPAVLTDPDTFYSLFLSIPIIPSTPSQEEPHITEAS